MSKLPALSRLAPALVLAVIVAVPSTASAAECQRRLALLGPNASDTRKLDALVICAEETRMDLSENDTAQTQITRDIAALRRDLTALEGKMGRDIASAVRGVDARLTSEVRTLREEIRKVERDAKSALRASEMGTNDTLATLRRDSTATKRGLDGLLGREWKQFGVATRSIGRSLRNETVNPITVAVTLRSGGSNSQRNPCHGRIKVDGVTVAESRDNNTSFSKQCFVTAMVPAGAK